MSINILSCKLASTLCLLGNFLLIFFNSTFSKYHQCQTVWIQIRLIFVGPDLDPCCLQTLSADHASRQRVKVHHWGKNLMSFVCFDSFGPSQQFFSHDRRGLPGLNQCYAADKVSYSRTQHSDSAGNEAWTSNSSITSLMLYQLGHCTRQTLR